MVGQGKVAHQQIAGNLLHPPQPLDRTVGLTHHGNIRPRLKHGLNSFANQSVVVHQNDSNHAAPLRLGRGEPLLASEKCPVEIYRSERTVVRKERDLLLKSPAAQPVEAHVRARYRREFHLLRQWDLAGVARPLRLLEEDGGVQLVFPDEGGRSLEGWLKQRSFSHPEVIRLMLLAARALSDVHAQGVVHGDVNPANLLWNPDNGRLQLIDFGLSSDRLQQRSEGQPLGRNLCYMAPERTGRIQRGLDYRADLYGLGATAWHLLTGQPPFAAVPDTAALLHAVLARQLEPPHQLRPQLPPGLSALLARLLAKDPEQRYQSLAAMVADLRALSGDPRALLAPGPDVPQHFLLPNRLYGRELQQQTLLDALQRAAAGGTATVWLLGGAGAGKSALAEELRRPTLERQGLFVAGRHELGRHDQPHSGLIQALREALRPLLGGSQAEVAAWRARFTACLGRNLGWLAHLLPELSLLLEAAPEWVELAPEQARSRLHLAISALVRELAGQLGPLVVFVDDFQWADRSAAQLLEFLATDPQMKGLLLVVGSRHQRQGPGQQLLLPPLDSGCCQQLVADACHRPLAEAAPLAALLHARTAGNPHFLRTLLAQLERAGQLSPRPDGQGWAWDLEAVSQLEVSEDGAAMMVAQLRQLPTATQHCLRTAACFGPRFRLTQLAQALEQTPSEVIDQLRPALESALLVPLGSDFRLVEFGASDQASYRFAHDRVQEAAYGLLETAERPQVHLRLGRLLAGGDRFEVVHQLRRGLVAMDHPDERLEFARLAATVARQARQQAAFETAFGCCEAGYQALGVQRWERHYSLTLALCSELVANALVLGESRILEQRLTELRERARSLADQIPAWTTRLRWLLAGGRAAEAFELSDQFLRLASRSQPRSGGRLALAWSWCQTQWALAGRGPDQLLDLAATKDPLLVGIQEVQTLAALAQSRVHPATIPLGILRDVRTVLRDGLTAHGAQCWTGYGLMLCAAWGRVQLGMRYAELALNQVARLGQPEVEPRVACLAFLLVRPWGTPIGLLVDPLRQISRRALEVGDTITAFFALLIGVTLEYHSGTELGQVGEQLQRIESALDHHRHPSLRGELAALQWAVTALQTGSLDPLEASDWGSDPFAPAAVRLIELQVALVFAQSQRAFALARLPRPDSPLLGPVLFLYTTYELVALLRGVEEGWLSWGALSRPLQSGLKILRQWAAEVPQRSWRLTWVEAARLRARGRLSAIASYDEAMEGARHSGHLHDAALICEQAAEFCQSRARWRAARVYRAEALQLYTQWGAQAKLAQLSQGQPDHGLDLDMVLRASRVLSSEIRLPALLQSLLELARENAGAERAVLVLRTEEGWDVDLDDDRLDMAASVLRYAMRTGAPVVVEDAIVAPTFGKDPYVLRSRPRSVLCVPLEHAGQLTGLLYLENNLAGGVFTAERTEVLRALSAQMAISLENARRFEQLQRQKQLEARQAALAAFLGVASHDLKSPLAAIGMWASQLNPSAARHNIEAALQRAEGLIASYLDVATLESGGQLSLHRQSCDLAELVQAEIDFQLHCLPVAERARVGLEWDLTSTPARLDRERMQQVVANLIGNALKHCPPGCRIAVTLAHGRFQVEDEGPGLAPHLQIGLFQPFERRTSANPGSGLGLWICRVIVEAHGGRIGVDSQAGRGSCFWFTLPTDSDP